MNLRLLTVVTFAIATVMLAKPAMAELECTDCDETTSGEICISGYYGNWLSYLFVDPQPIYSTCTVYGTPAPTYEDPPMPISNPIAPTYNDPPMPISNPIAPTYNDPPISTGNSICGGLGRDQCRANASTCEWERDYSSSNPLAGFCVPLPSNEQ
jgi:hypothetical protein